MPDRPHLFTHGNMVSAEMNYPGRYKGMLRARTSGNKDPKKWELFRVCDEATYSTIQLMSTGLYVSAELDYTGADYGMGVGRAGLHRRRRQHAARPREGLRKVEAFYSTTLVFQHGDYENARPPARS